MNMEVPRVSLPMVYCFLISAIFFQFVIAGSSDDLKVGFYSNDPTNSKTYCPSAETTIREAIKEALGNDYGPAASLIRWHFHDCFVRGCDASVLLNKSADIPNPENAAFFNMRGYYLIEAAKTAVENICPEVVSCADILAFAARDAFYLLTGKSDSDLYSVSAGRRDGNISLLTEATTFLPRPDFGFSQLTNSFAAKGFSTDEMITLSGAHSVGQSHCSSFTSRLYPYNPDQIDPSYAQALQILCPQNAAIDGVVPQDNVTPDTLDAQYYTNVLNNEVLFFSDWALRNTSDLVAKVTIQSYTTPLIGNALWKSKFIAAMQKLGRLDVLTGTQGQIRKTCGANN
ncbi:Peroxidase [Rhynchospora pubera]|uniref:Peroxidase n=1 Tax=Rhynchospora pubera TaxID=906938 RepID=A0AAV8GPH7_9POAL|nr:Peroxidase [Rhynchospora pubera]